MDMDAVIGLLCQTYWWSGYTDAPDRIRRAAAHSALRVGAFLPDGRQIGFVRVVSDFVRIAYIADVVVCADCRRRGVAKAMLRYVVESETLRDVGKFLLITGDAHGFYERAGFHVTTRGGDYMELKR